MGGSRSGAHPGPCPGPESNLSLHAHRLLAGSSQFTPPPAHSPGSPTRFLSHHLPRRGVSVSPAMEIGPQAAKQDRPGLGTICKSGSGSGSGSRSGPARGLALPLRMASRRPRRCPHLPPGSAPQPAAASPEQAGAERASGRPQRSLEGSKRKANQTKLVSRFRQKVILYAGKFGKNSLTVLLGEINT